MYILWYCDEWTSRKSMRVRMVSSEREKIEASILRGIEADKFDYTGTPDQNYRKNMAREFQNDCKTRKTIRDINAALRFGYIEEIEDGEEY